MTTDSGTVTSSSGISDTQAGTSDDSITRWFAGATVLWGAIAAFVGMIVASFMLLPETHRQFGDLSVYLSYGRIRPVFATIAVYAFAGKRSFHRDLLFDPAVMQNADVERHP